MNSTLPRLTIISRLACRVTWAHSTSHHPLLPLRLRDHLVIITSINKVLPLLLRRLTLRWLPVCRLHLDRRPVTSERRLPTRVDLQEHRLR